MKNVLFFVIAILTFATGYSAKAADQATVPAAPAAPAVVQNAKDASADTDVSYGTLVKLDPETIVISEYDAEKDAQADIAYSLESKTEVVNAAALDKIKAGAGLEVEYAVSDDKKIAKKVTVEAAGEGEE